MKSTWTGNIQLASSQDKMAEIVLVQVFAWLHISKCKVQDMSLDELIEKEYVPAKARALFHSFGFVAIVPQLEHGTSPCNEKGGASSG